MKGKTTDALRILEKMTQLNQRKLPSGLLVSTKKDRKDEEFAPTEEVTLLSSTIKNTEIVMTRLNWRWLLAFSSIPAFALLFFYTLVPESARFLCMKGNTIDAHYILEKNARLNRTEIPSGMLVSNAKERQDEEFDPTEETHLLSSTKKKPEELKKGLSLFFILFYQA
nr:organic cation/carnitine transporter 7 [Quercus suber]